MILRILVLSLFSAAQSQYHQFGAQLQSPHGSECALLLAGPGRSSVYDYNVNLFRGTLRGNMHALSILYTYDNNNNNNNDNDNDGDSWL
ncbi:hypothetical protein AWZ03_001556 [Drosophila navojoa]|uniref:Uncharacterized protein n=1 Tax=Drosophila navojoa TaxID=7232 RepID=A0A484BSU6_DRONA|nr:hypothetical protein AWZ03_001556 [Drosophila navojoa]